MAFLMAHVSPTTAYLYFALCGQQWGTHINAEVRLFVSAIGPTTTTVQLVVVGLTEHPAGDCGWRSPASRTPTASFRHRLTKSRQCVVLRDDCHVTAARSNLEIRALRPSDSAFSGVSPNRTIGAVLLIARWANAL